MNQIMKTIQSYHPEMTTWRRDLHAHPETAFEEYRTAEFVATKLQEFGLEVHTGLAKTGVVGTLSTGSGPSIGLRADMDALNMQEENEFEYRSRNTGKMHACGHDGHTTMLLGAAKYLSANQNFKGTIRFIFQPAEENEAGGRFMVEEGLFDNFPVDAIFGMHNWPGMDAGKIGLRVGPMMASFDTFEIQLRGEGTHAAAPHCGTDAVLTAGELICALQRVVSRSNPLESLVLSITQVHGGDTWNVIPEQVVLRGTVRSYLPELQDLAEKQIGRIAAGVCQAADIQHTFRYERRYPPTINTAKETEFSAQIAAELLGAQNVDMGMAPSMGSEDFSFMLQKRPGCYVRIGNGPRAGGCMLHNPRYDFNDEILPVGAGYWALLAERFLVV